MNKGDKFSTHKYELCASIDATVGGGGSPSRVLVMHNNSSHFLVATSDNPLQVAVDSGTEEEEATLLGSFEYASDPGITHRRYAEALHFAVRWALHH